MKWTSQWPTALPTSFTSKQHRQPTLHDNGAAKRPDRKWLYKACGGHLHITWSCQCVGSRASCVHITWSRLGLCSTSCLSSGVERGYRVSLLRHLYLRGSNPLQRISEAIELFYWSAQVGSNSSFRWGSKRAASGVHDATEMLSERPSRHVSTNKIPAFRGRSRELCFIWQDLEYLCTCFCARSDHAFVGLLAHSLSLSVSRCWLFVFLNK